MGAGPVAGRVRGCILSPQGWLVGSLRHEGGRIVAVEGQPVVGPVPGDELPIVLPGFLDLHVHGGGGVDVMDGGDAVAVVARTHARHGTTALLATTLTAPSQALDAALDAVAPHCAEREGGGARVLGVHLEGPFINSARLGAQPPHARAASREDILRWHRKAPLKVITLAPEVEGHLALIPWLCGLGARVQLGHSDARYEDAEQAFRAGASGCTHLFNAMSPLHHRAPGLVGAALALAEYSELIPDLLHVHPGALRAALRAIPGAFVVTDATAAAGMPDGPYQLGGQAVERCMGAVRLPDGTLAGSVLTMDQALRNLVSLGLPLAEASARVSSVPARYLGLQDRGVLAVGARADVVELDTRLQVQRVHVEGEVTHAV